VTRRVGVLISGRGSNLGALLAAVSADPGFPATIALVLSNRPDAGGLALAAQAGVPAAVVDHRDYGRDRAAHEAALDARLRAAGVEIVCLAGYMRLMTPFLVNAWAGRMLNIHPSLLPAFPGLDTHRRALAGGVCLHGCTVHLVTEGMDQGPDRDGPGGVADQSLAGRAGPEIKATYRPRTAHAMGQTTSAVASPVTEEALLADRQRFWGGFTTATAAAVVFIVLVLVLMAIFLL
jgi:phosphoribosylglycinamide formyltransferase-1